MKKRGLNLQDAKAAAKAAKHQYKVLEIDAKNKIEAFVDKLFGEDTFDTIRTWQSDAPQELTITFYNRMVLHFYPRECLIQSLQKQKYVIAQTRFDPYGNDDIRCIVEDGDYNYPDLVVDPQEDLARFVRKHVNLFARLAKYVYEVQHSNEIDEVRDSIVTLICIKKFASSCLDVVPLDVVRLIAKMCWAMRV